MNTYVHFFVKIALSAVFAFKILFGAEVPLTYYQPDKFKTSFEGYSWGDRFLWYHETTAGYRFMQRTNGWYHYVCLDAQGGFKMTQYTVGIDDPPEISYKLERSSRRIAALEDSISAYSDSIALRHDWWSSLDSLRLGILLVTFPDAEPFTSNNQPLDRVDGFLVEDFERPLFTANYGYTDTSIGGYEVFGSMRDYYLEQSNDELIIYGNVINATLGNGTPDWLMMPDSIAHYSGNLDSSTLEWDHTGTGLSGLRTDSGADTLIGTYDAVVIVYSDRHLSGSNLNPVAAWNIPIYTVGEKSGRFEDIYSMGIHCHELGHNFGWPHLAFTPYYYTLMKTGSSNSEVLSGGYRKSGTCPSSVNPFYKIDEGWSSYTDTITQDTIGLKILYDYDNPLFYTVPFSSGGNSYHYILENRQHDEFDRHTPIPSTATADAYADPSDVNGNKGGLLIWQVRGNYYWAVRLLDAAGSYYDLPGGTNEWNDWVPDRFTAYTQIPFPLYQDQSIDNVTGHVTTYGGNLDSPVVFRNIHWDAADSSVTMDIYTNAYTGNLSGIDTINSDIALYDSVVFSGNVYIPAGVTVKVLPGANISMPYGKKIEVKGSLEAMGNDSTQITFTSTTSGYTNRWYGFSIKNGGELIARYTDIDNSTYGLFVQDVSSHADVRYCDFTNNAFGFRVTSNPDIDIRNNSFSDNMYAIVLFYSDCDVFANDFDNNLYGIYGYYSDFDADDNEIHNAASTGAGVYLSRSNPTLDRNDIGDNWHGLRCYSYSGPDLTSAREEDDDDVNNYIHDSGYAGVYVSSSSAPDLGVYTAIGGPVIYEGGFNFFDDNASYDIYNNTATTIMAQVNWWENDNPNNYGSVTTTYQADNVLGTGPGNLPKGSTDENLLAFYQQARLLEKDSLYLDAIAFYDSILVNGEGSTYQHVAMIGIERCGRSMGSQYDFVGKMDDIQLEYSTGILATLANYMAAGELARSGALTGAISRYESSLEGFEAAEGMTEQEAWTLFDIGRVAEILEETQAGLGKAAQANKALLAGYPESEAAALLKDLMGGDDHKEEVVSLPTEFKLNHPYPNPFNPSTTIAYELPKTADITITVYDILGRNVWSHEESAKPAGHYSLQWNGLNNNGKLAASGIYLISFSTPGFTSVQKAVLIR